MKLNMGTVTRRLGKIVSQNALLFLCDMQEGFRNYIKYFPQIVEVSNRMLQASQHLDMPIITTEQYPKGLGHTVSELDVSNTKVFTKTRFSMCIPDVQEYLQTIKDRKSVVLCGIETQACVQQTALDLLEQDYDVHVIVDGCSSRSMVDRMYAFQRMKDAGAYLTTSESMLLTLLQDAKHPKFKQVQKLIMTEAPDSGLLYK